jgi:hypothetical protein
MKCWTTGCTALALALSCTLALSQITTSQYDNMYTGATLRDKILTPANVSARQFGKLGALKLDGAIYAQPLLLPGLDVPI